MIKRIRDGIKNFKPQGHISFKEWEEITDRASFAKQFLKETNLVYLRLKEDLESLQNTILENRVYGVQEENMITDVFKKVFVIPRQVQVDEITGQYKYIKSLLAELQLWIDTKKQLEKDEADGKITIEHE